VQRGTGTGAKSLSRPVAGKTGTSSDYKDAWFIGFTPELAVGVYMGFDKPRNMGSQATGGELAVPVFTEFMQAALNGKPATPFVMPQGMSEIWIDPATGVKASPGQAAIEEAFKPGTGPNLVTSVIGLNTFGGEQPIGPDPGLWGDQCFGDQCFDDGGTFDDRDDEGSFTETDNRGFLLGRGGLF
jgi:penicillin-binding protein 1A